MNKLAFELGQKTAATWAKQFLRTASPEELTELLMDAHRNRRMLGQTYSHNFHKSRELGLPWNNPLKSVIDNESENVKYINEVLREKGLK